MSIQLRTDPPTLTTSADGRKKDRGEDALFKQLVEQQDARRDAAAAAPQPAASPAAPAAGETVGAVERAARDQPAQAPTRTEIDAADAEAAGLTVNGQTVAAVNDGGATAALVNASFDAGDDAALMTAVGAAERLVAAGAERNAVNPVAFAAPGDGKAATEKSTAAEALNRVVGGGDPKPKPGAATPPPAPNAAADDAAPSPQPTRAPVKASVVDEAAAVVNKPNQALSASAQAAAQRAQDVASAARDMARGPLLDMPEPTMAAPKTDGAGVRPDAQQRPSQANAQAAADKALASQAAAQAAADKAHGQAARAAPTRSDAPPPPSAPSPQPQPSQQSSFANMLQAQAKTGDGAKTEQSGFQHQARAAHQSHAVAEQVAVQIRKGFQGLDRIQIQMKPAELGRVDVEMRLDSQGRIAIVVQADRPETVEMLQRESKTLEQALKDAGFDLSDGALSFGARGEDRGFADRNDLSAMAALGAEADGAALEDAPPDPVTATDALRRMSNPDAIDLVV